MKATSRIANCAIVTLALLLITGEDNRQKCGEKRKFNDYLALDNQALNFDDLLLMQIFGSNNAEKLLNLGGNNQIYRNEDTSSQSEFHPECNDSIGSQSEIETYNGDISQMDYLQSILLNFAEFWDFCAPTNSGFNDPESSDGMAQDPQQFYVPPFEIESVINNLSVPPNGLSDFACDGDDEEADELIKQFSKVIETDEKLFNDDLSNFTDTNTDIVFDVCGWPYYSEIWPCGLFDENGYSSSTSSVGSNQMFPQYSPQNLRLHSHKTANDVIVLDDEDDNLKLELIELLKNAVPLPAVESDQEALKSHWIFLSTNYLDLHELHKKLKENKVKARNFRKSDFNKVAHNESKLTIERIDKIFATYNTSSFGIPVRELLSFGIPVRELYYLCATVFLELPIMLFNLFGIVNSILTILALCACFRNLKASFSSSE